MEDGIPDFDDDGSDFDEDLYLRAYLGQLGNDGATQNTSKPLESHDVNKPEQKSETVLSEDQAQNQTSKQTTTHDNNGSESHANTLISKEDEDEKSSLSDFAEEEFKKKFSGSRYFLEDESIKCYNCNGYGHMASQCIEEKEIKSCFLCGANDHARSRCPQELCINCQQPGHQSRECSLPRSTNQFCTNCGLLGHNQKDCKQDRMGWRGRPSNIFCYNCGKKGHNGIQCSLPRMDDLMVSEVSKSSTSPAASILRLHLRQRRRSDPGDLRRWQERFREGSSDDSDEDNSYRRNRYESTHRSRDSRDNRDNRDFRNHSDDRNSYRNHDNRYDKKNHDNKFLNQNRNNREHEHKNNNNRNNNHKIFDEEPVNIRRDNHNTPNADRGRQSERKSDKNNFAVVHNNKATPKSSVVDLVDLTESHVKGWDEDTNDIQTNIQTHNRRSEHRDDNNYRKRSRSEPGRAQGENNKKHRK